MVDLYKPKLTREEQQIDEAINTHRDALRDETRFGGLAFVLYFAGLFLSIIGSNGSRTDRVGNALFLCAVVSFVIHVGLGFRTRKYRYAAKELIDQYKRKNALPFYQELCQMFAEHPGVSLHLNDDGSITVRDQRKTETS